MTVLLNTEGFPLQVMPVDFLFRLLGVFLMPGDRLGPDTFGLARGVDTSASAQGQQQTAHPEQP